MSSAHRTILETRLGAWPQEAACAGQAAALGAQLLSLDAVQPQGGSWLVELHGDLGAGKTTFVRHLLRSLGVSGRIKSPTYALMESYRVPLAGDGAFAARALEVAHLDFYRFEDPREWADAGLREVFHAPGLKLVEWPCKAATLLPAPDLRLHLQLAPTAAHPECRSVRAEALSAAGLALLQAWQEHRP